MIIKPPNVIPKTTVAKEGTVVITKALIGTSLQVDGNLATDEIPVYFLGANGTDTTAVTDENGDALKLSASRTGFTFFGTGVILLDKPATTNAVGVNHIR